MKAWYFTGDQRCAFGPDGNGAGARAPGSVGNGGSGVGSDGSGSGPVDGQGDGWSNHAWQWGRHVTLPRQGDSR